MIVTEVSKFNNILVTGSHRSGSTWIGKALVSSGMLDYVHEPFNLDIASRYNSPVEHWFEYVGENEEKRKTYAEYLRYYTRGSLNCVLDRVNRNPPRKIPQILISETRKAVRRQKPKLVKDPMAVFSADFFAKVLNYKILITIRHPAAFAESLKNMNWTHDFSDFLKQEELMEEVIPQYKKEIEGLVRSSERRNDVIENAVLLWKMIHSRIIEYRRKYKEWLFIKHEALSLDPMEEFRKIFDHFQVPFNDSAKAYIENSTSGTGITGENRDSIRNVTKWTSHLTPDEISLINRKTADVARYFYCEEEWFRTLQLEREAVAVSADQNR